MTRTALTLALLLCTSAALAEPVQETQETKDAVAAIERWRANAEKDCAAKFDVWFDLGPYDGYTYADTPRERLLGAGYLGLFGGNFFTEMSSACRTFRDNSLSECAVELQQFTKIVFRPHAKLDAKNTDASIEPEGDTLTVIYPPSIQWQTELLAKQVYDKLDCDGNEPLPAAAPKGAAPRIVAASAKEVRKSVKEMKRWKGIAETDCETKFDVSFDLGPHDGYPYGEDVTKKKALGTGYLGLYGTNFFNELRGACRTFNGNEPTTCVPVLQKFKKLVFRGHDDWKAKNTDVALKADGDTLTVVYPPNIQWQTELMAKTLYEQFDCDGNQAR